MTNYEETAESLKQFAIKNSSDRMAMDESVREACERCIDWAIDALIEAGHIQLQTATTYGNDFDPYEGGMSYVNKVIKMGKERREQREQDHFAGVGNMIRSNHFADAGKLIDTILRDLAYDCVVRVRGSNDVPAFDACVEAEYQNYKACLEKNMADYAADSGHPKSSTDAMYGYDAGFEDGLAQSDWTIPSDIPFGYRISVEQTAHPVDNKNAWLARLITGIQGKDCIKGYGPTPRDAAYASIAKTKGDNDGY